MFSASLLITSKYENSINFENMRTLPNNHSYEAEIKISGVLIFLVPAIFSGEEETYYFTFSINRIFFFSMRVIIGSFTLNLRKNSSGH